VITGIRSWYFAEYNRIEMIDVEDMGDGANYVSRFNDHQIEVIKVRFFVEKTAVG